MFLHITTTLMAQTTVSDGGNAFLDLSLYSKQLVKDSIPLSSDFQGKPSQYKIQTKFPAFKSDPLRPQANDYIVSVATEFHLFIKYCSTDPSRL